MDLRIVVLAPHPDDFDAIGVTLRLFHETIAMRCDLYTSFGEAEAAWKGELLRFHRSQHERNLRTRQHGFDEPILQVNREIAAELEIPAGYAEAFEVEFYG